MTLYSKSKQVTGYCIETVQTIEICGFFYRKKDIIGKKSRKSMWQNENSFANTVKVEFHCKGL